MKYDAIILAAGSAVRSNLNYNKVFYKLKGKEIIYLSTYNFQNDPDCQKIIVAVNENEKDKILDILKDFSKIELVIGGKTRQQSVKNALSKVEQDYVLIHDGARPNFTNDLLDKLKKDVLVHEVVIPVVSLTDTIFMVKDNKVSQILNRNELGKVQTPQAFKSSLIKKAHSIAIKDDYSDDSMMIKDLLKKDIYVIDGEITNKKYTYSDDFKE